MLEKGVVLEKGFCLLRGSKANFVCKKINFISINFLGDSSFPFNIAHDIHFLDPPITLSRSEHYIPPIDLSIMSPLFEL